jgi:hypothetical protein
LASSTDPATDRWKINPRPDLSTGIILKLDDAFHIVDNNRTGKLAIGKKHRDDLRPAGDSAATRHFALRLARRPDYFESHAAPLFPLAALSDGLPGSASSR